MFLSKSKLGIFYRFRSLFLPFVALTSQEALILKNHPRKKTIQNVSSPSPIRLSTSS